MKKVLNLMITLAIIFSMQGCKRKLVEVAPDGTLIKLAAHCYNNTYDSLEVGTDCGGECTPCKIVSPECTQTDNTLTFNSTNSAIFNIATTITDDYYYDFTGNFQGGDVLIRLSGNVPDMTKAYSLDSNNYPSYGKAYVTLNHPIYDNMVASAGKVFVNQKNGKFIVYACDVTFYSWTAQTTFKFNKIAILVP